MLTHYVKVKFSGKKAIYLEGAKYFTNHGITFLTGTQVTKFCEPTSQMEVIHIISVGTQSTGPMPLFTPFAAVKIWTCEVNKTYCELEAKEKIQ